MIAAVVWLLGAVFVIHSLAGVPVLATVPPALIIGALGGLLHGWVLPADRAGRDR